MLIQVVVAMLSPLVLLPGFLGLAGELLFDALDWTVLGAAVAIPLYLVISVFECAWRSMDLLALH